MGGVRLAALWILLVAVYATTVSIPAQIGMDYAGAEPHHLLAAESIVSDRDVDLTDEYAERAYASWYPKELKTDGQVVAGRLMEPHGVGYAVLIAPAYALGGARAVQWEMVALMAFAFVLAAALARRMVPEPWATAGAALVGLSPPALAASTTVTPGVPAAVLLSGAALCALAVRERPRLRYVFGGALLLAGLPWLGWTFVAPGVVIAWALVTWTLRERRRLAALVAGEALAASLVFYAMINDRLYGGLTPRAAGLTGPAGAAVRLHRAAAAARGAMAGSRRRPAALGAAAGARLLLRVAAVQLAARPARARRDRPPRGRGLRRAAARRRRRPAAGRRAVLDRPACAAGFPGVQLVAALPAAAALTAWGLRHVPRPLAALLALFTLGASTYLVLAERSGNLGGWLEVDTKAPWGPPVVLFPNFTGSAVWPALLCRCWPPARPSCGGASAGRRASGGARRPPRARRRRCTER